MPEIHGSFSYPGLAGPMAISYSCTHGITPGVVVIRCHPQDINKVAQIGNVIIEDGVNRVTIPQCRLNTVDSVMSGSGFEWRLQLVDRRWKWRDIGLVEGWYNQPDPRGKYVPWTVRSPYELALLCLQQMGESRFTIDLPPGLSRRDGQNYQEFLQSGQLFPQTSTNPPVNWQPESPAQALARLCDYFGRRLIYDVCSDSIIIARAGQGAVLPQGSIASAGPSLRSPETPDAIMVYGSPTKYQARFHLIPVGEDWNGQLKPIDLLSYTPTYTAQTRRISVRITMPPDADRTNLQYRFALTISRPADRGPEEFVSLRNVAVGDTAQDQLHKVGADMLAALLAPDIRTLVFADGHIELEGTNPTVNFALAYAGFLKTNGSAIPPSAKSIQIEDRPAYEEGPTWRYSDYNNFDGVVATPQLQYKDARLLAQKCIGKMFLITGYDPADTSKYMTIPAFGQIQRRQQIIPLSTKVDQVVPSRDSRVIVDQGVDLKEPLVLDLYNGYSRDKPARLIGAVSIPEAFETGRYEFLLGTVNNNTAVNQELPMTVSIDPNFMIVQTPNRLFYNNAGRKDPPKIVLETGCNVRDYDTNAVACYKAIRLLANGKPSGTGVKVYRHPDVQLNVTATYNDDHTINQVSLLEPDAVLRAQYYLDAHGWEYIMTDGQNLEYNGIVIVHLDGAINTVTWEADGSGCKTRATRNTLPPWMPSYPERRRQENMDAAPRILSGLQKTIPRDMSIGNIEDAAAKVGGFLFG